MKKTLTIKNLIIILTTGVILLIGYFSIFFYQNYKVNKINSEYLENLSPKDFTEDIRKKYSLKRCNFGIFNSKYYKVTGGDNQALISFYKFNTIYLNNLNKENITDSQTGFTTIKNTTFPQLLKMVKEDCSQFQKSGSIGIEEKDTIWSYSKAESQESINQRKEESKKREIETLRNDIDKLSEEKIEELTEKYGYKENFKDEELLQWTKEVDLTNFDSGIEPEEQIDILDMPGFEAVE